MGGFGSGRSWSCKPKVEQASMISLHWLFKHGYIRRGLAWGSHLNWTSVRDKTPRGSIGLRTWCGVEGEPDRIELHGTYSDEPFTQTIWLASIPGTKGGRRWFAVCPASGRRCLKLVLSRKHRGWVSVPASGLRYYTECMDSFDRCRERVGRAEAKITKLSKYARYPTRDRLEKELWAAEDGFHRALQGFRAKLNARLASAGIDDEV
jgi:hypothetical protein